MERMVNLFKKNLKLNKINIFIVFSIFIVLLILTIPTLATFKKSNILQITDVWDGNVASSFKSGNGTKENPYLISNGSELAYLATQLETNDFDGIDFFINSNIFLNEGIIKYDEQGITYILDQVTYFVDEYTNKYYDNIQKNGEEIGTLNIFPSLDNFKGNLDGNFNSIYGLYITDDANELGLFTNLQGNIQNLYIKNALIYGGLITGGIASTAHGSELNNIIFDGFVVGKNENNVIKESIDLIGTPIVVGSNDTYNYIDTSFIDLEQNYLVNTTITGEYEVSGAKPEEVSIKINNTEITDGLFEVDLGQIERKEIEIISSSASLNETILTFTNLKYNINLATGIAGGIIALADNTSIENVINKATIFGNANSGGLIGKSNNNTTINQSYNAGIIQSNYIGGGLISAIENNVGYTNITKAYNTYNSLNHNGLIGIIENNLGVVTLNNVFDASFNSSIGSINNTSVNITNTYYVSDEPVGSGTINGTFTKTDVSNLQSRNLIDLIAFNEYIDEEDYDENKHNIWIYNDQAYPILKFDDTNNSPSNIYIGNMFFNNFNVELKKRSSKSNITFTVEAGDILNPIKDIYVYISDSNVPLSKNDLEQITSWEKFSEIVSITDEGNYIIYAKVVDYNDRITYINTDIMIIDITAPNISIKLDDEHSWTEYKESPSNIIINKKKEIEVQISDNLSEIENLEYFVSDTQLSQEELEELSEDEWNIYEEKININKSGSYIIYVKGTDEASNIKLVNTDNIILDGYDARLFIGYNNDYESNSVTEHSLVTLDFNYHNEEEINGEIKHYLKSNILLPKNTKITLIDQSKNKFYSLIIDTDEDLYDYETNCLEDNCAAVYPFTLFKEIGKIDNNYFIEDSYFNAGKTTENFTITVDFKNANIDSDYSDVMVYLEAVNADTIRKTILEEISFNLYKNKNASIELEINYAGNPLYLNRDSITNINLKSKINFLENIIDTRYEHKYLGVEIKITDVNDNVIEKEKLKTLQLLIDDKNYYFGNDNTVRVKLDDATKGFEEILTIKTNEGNTDLPDNVYYLKVNSFASVDGIYPKIISESINIPLNVIKNKESIYTFDIKTTNNLMINKNDIATTLNFNIIHESEFINPSIRVSIYEKDLLTAYNQDYSLIDLNLYTSNNLYRHLGYVYYANIGEFKLNFINEKFKYTSYKLVFELYDENNLIDTIKKYLIVR